MHNNSPRESHVVLPCTNKYHTALTATTLDYAILRFTQLTSTMKGYAVLFVIPQYGLLTHNTIQHLPERHSNNQYDRVLPSTRQYYPVGPSTTHYYSVLNTTTPYYAAVCITTLNPPIQTCNIHCYAKVTSTTQ